MLQIGLKLGPVIPETILLTYRSQSQMNSIKYQYVYITFHLYYFFLKRTLGIPMSLFPAEPSLKFPILFGALAADLVPLLSFVVFSVGVEGRTSKEFSFCLLAAGFLSPPSPQLRVVQGPVSQAHIHFPDLHLTV